MGTAGLFLTPWFPDFDPATVVITRTPVWIRLPNLPVHLWHVRVYRVIGDTLGTFLMGDYLRFLNDLTQQREPPQACQPKKALV